MLWWALTSLAWGWSVRLLVLSTMTLIPTEWPTSVDCPPRYLWNGGPGKHSEQGRWFTFLVSENWGKDECVVSIMKTFRLSHIQVSFEQEHMQCLEGATLQVAHIFLPWITSILSPGGVSEHETLGNVECYDPETDRWVVDVIPQMRYRRSGVGVAVLQGLLFAIGGYLEGKTSTDAVECYNPRTKRYVLSMLLSLSPFSLVSPLSLSLHNNIHGMCSN